MPKVPKQTLYLHHYTSPAETFVFHAKDLADVAETVKNSFDDLTGVSPLWFSVEKDEDAGAGGHSLGSKHGGAGYEMFGDWRVEESLLDVFENQPQAGSDKQVCSSKHARLNVFYSLLAGSKPTNSQGRNQGLEGKKRARGSESRSAQPIELIGREMLSCF